MKIKKKKIVPHLVSTLIDISGGVVENPQHRKQSIGDSVCLKDVYRTRPLVMLTAIFQKSKFYEKKNKL